MSEQFTHSIANCQRFNDLLKAAGDAIEQLGLRGCVPRQVSLAGPRPVIQIDPPTGTTFIRGAMRFRERNGRVTRTVMAAPFYGCRLEWEVADINREQALQ